MMQKSAASAADARSAAGARGAKKHWQPAEPAPPAHLARYRDFSPILAQILYNRGFEDPVAAEGFIHDSHLTEDPSALKDIDKAVARINAAIAAQEAIAVYGDYDADGVTATVLMVQVLQRLGACVRPYIPTRAEGYGLHESALEGLAARGIQLVVTVDCGIRSVAEVIAGQQAGLDIIITDHHSLGSEIPPALAVINPKQDDCAGNPHLAGVGIVYMLCKALLRHRWHNDRANYPPSLRESDLLDLVALGTVADVGTLKDSLNRRLVQHGLNTINQMQRPGLAALAQVAGLHGRITAANVGFALGPRINAAGRLGDPMPAYELLALEDDESREPAETWQEAMALARNLQGINAKRRNLIERAQTAIQEKIDADAQARRKGALFCRISPAREASEYKKFQAQTDTAEKPPPLIFAVDDSFQPGIVGLVAGRVSEKYYRPAVILAKDEESNESRASCRSIPEFNIVQALDECADLLIRHGGHAMAAGFTIASDKIPLLKERLMQKAAAALAGRELMPRLRIDAELAPHELSRDLVDELAVLEPTGHGNPPALFMTRGLEVSACRRVGEAGRHLKLRFVRRAAAPLDAIGFGLGDWAASLPSVIDAVYHLEMNEWKGNRRLQMRLLDIRAAQVDR